MTITIHFHCSLHLPQKIKKNPHPTKWSSFPRVHLESASSHYCTIPSITMGPLLAGTNYFSSQIMGFMSFVIRVAACVYIPSNLACFSKYKQRRIIIGKSYRSLHYLIIKPLFLITMLLCFPPSPSIHPERERSMAQVSTPSGYHTG